MYIYVYIYVCVYIYDIYIYIFVAKNFTVVLLQPLLPSVYVLLYFDLFVYHDCMFYSM